MAELGHVAVGADLDALAADRRPSTPKPGHGLEVRDGGQRQPSSVRPRPRWRAAIGCSDLRLDGGDQRQHLGPVEAGGQLEIGQRRLALGQRAGLVERDDLGVLAAAAAPRPCGTARRARRRGPVPTMIEVGVASPMAQGQAMISTATALTRAKVSAGDGPKTSQTAKVSAATAITAGTNHMVTLSTSAWIGSLEPCASSTMRMICASTVSPPTAVARKAKRAGLVDGAADDLAAGRLARPGPARR